LPESRQSSEIRPATTGARPYVAILAVCLVAGLPSISRYGYFLGDDFGLVQHLHDLPLDRLFAYFASDWTEGIYGFTLDELRPFLAFTYWFDSHVFGAANAPAYHITNIALHVLNTLLVFAIATSLAPARTDVAVLAASLFAVMPSHAEPIAWISGRVDSLAAAFYLGAILCFIRFRSRASHGWLAAALVLFAFGLFAKQSIVTFPVLILAYDVTYGPSLRSLTTRQLVSRCLVHVPFAVILVLYLGLRRTLFGNFVRESLLTIETFKSFVDRQSFYIGQMLPVPSDIPSDAKTAVLVFTWGVLAACTVWLLARWQSNRQIVRHLIFFGATWYAVTVAPMIVTYASARHLYLTAAGLSVALASLLLPAGWRSTGRSKAVRGIAVGVLVVLCAAALFSNMRGWIANGIESRRLATALPVLLQSLPAGSTVMLDIRHTRRGVWFWSWALPFALQRPFVGEDLYEQFAIVEWPIVYCCLPHQWWAAKQSALGPILQSEGTHKLTYIVPDERDASSLIVEKRTVSGAALRTKIETAIGRSVDTLATSITQDEAQRVAEILFE
jgi:hypothetical protein